MKIDLNEYGPLISDKNVGNKIYVLIKDGLSNSDVVEIDLMHITTMATFCAKQIFGKLYLELGSSKFFERIKLFNSNEDLKIIIKMGIQNAIDEHKHHS